MLSLSGEWLFFHLFVKVQTPLPTFLFLFFPFYREERDSWQTSAGRKVKVGLGGLDVPSISTLLVFFLILFLPVHQLCVWSWNPIKGGINQPWAHS